MAVPSAQAILAMLDPYKGFSTAASAQAGIAAGNVAADSRAKRDALAQQKQLAMVDDARAGQYLDLQKQGQAFNQKQDLNDRRMKAYAGFQAAVDAGDTEGAGLAANQLRMLGVDVQEYGGQDAGPQPAAPRAPATPPLTQQSPTAAVAQAQAQRAPMSAKDSQTDKELGKLQQETQLPADDTVSPGAPSTPGYSLEAMEAPSVRPRATQSLASTGRPKTVLEQKIDRMASDPGRRTSPLLPRIEAQSAGDPGNRESPLVQKLADAYGIPYLSAKRAHSIILKEMENGLGEPDMEAPIGAGSEKPPPGDPAPGADPMQAVAVATGHRPGPARSQYIKGQEPAPAGQATPQQGLIRGYRLSFDGQTIDIDPQSVQERQRQRVASALRPLFDNARTPEEENAARTAIQAAMASVGTLKPNEAIEYGLGLYKDPLDRGAKEKRARIVSGKGGGVGDGFGGVGGLDKNKNQLLGQLNDDIRSYVQGFETKFDVTNLRKSLDNGNKVAGLLGSKNSVGQRAALTSTLKAWFGSASSNTELKFVLESSGKWASLENQYNAWVNGGELSDDFVRNLKEAIAITNDFARRKLHDVGEQAAQGLENDFTFTSRMTPEQAKAAADNIRGRFTGVYRTEKKKEGAPLQRGSKAPAKAAPSPAKGSAAERAKRLGY